MSGGNSGAIRVWRALGRSCGGCWSLLEGGLGRSPGEGPAGGAEGRLKGRGGAKETTIDLPSSLGVRKLFFHFTLAVNTVVSWTIIEPV